MANYEHLKIERELFEMNVEWSESQYPKTSTR